MRKICLIALSVLFSLSLFGCTAASAPQDTPAPRETDEIRESAVSEAEFAPHTPESFKGLWLSQWDLKNVYVVSGVQRDEADFRARAQAIMENCADAGFNTVLIQVRPFGDSFYPSELYPPAAMAVGAYGQDFAYDPFRILLSAAHDAHLSVQAWINPLRLMKSEELERIDPKFTVRRWYDDEKTRGNYLVLQPDGRWYLNPGYAEVRELIVSGARELLERYEVDGLHLDDYFYPTTDESYDLACFHEAKSANGELELAFFRRQSLTLLIRELYRTVHKTRPGAVFGIAPGGNLDDDYLCKYADLYTWCGEDACVDYLCPEIYFGFEHEFCPFDKTAQLWSDTVKNPAVKLYYGLSFHKVALEHDPYAGTGSSEWIEHSDILARSLECVCGIRNCSGVCVFSYGYLFDPLTGTGQEWTKTERENFFSLWQTASFPAA